MPNVAHLLTVASDDPSIAVPEMPAGTWKGELKAISTATTGKDGKPLVDKNGNAYNRVRFLCVPTTPMEDVDRKEAKAFMEADGPDEVGLISMSQNVYRKRDISKLNSLLDSLGVPRRGRSYEQIAAEYKGGIPCLFEVEIDGEWGPQITHLYPVPD